MQDTRVVVAVVVDPHSYPPLEVVELGNLSEFASRTEAQRWSHDVTRAMRNIKISSLETIRGIWERVASGVSVTDRRVRVGVAEQWRLRMRDALKMSPCRLSVFDAIERTDKVWIDVKPMCAIFRFTSVFGIRQMESLLALAAVSEADLRTVIRAGASLAESWQDASSAGPAMQPTPCRPGRMRFLLARFQSSVWLDTVYWNGFSAGGLRCVRDSNALCVAVQNVWNAAHGLPDIGNAWPGLWMELEAVLGERLVAMKAAARGGVLIAAGCDGSHESTVMLLVCDDNVGPVWNVVLQILAQPVTS